MKGLVQQKTVHFLSAVAMVSILFIGGISVIRNNVAYLDVFNYELEIGRCFFKNNTNLDCPSCGMTRSFISIMDLDFDKAISYHRIGPFTFLLIVLLLIYNVLSLMKFKKASTIGRFLVPYSVIVCIAVVVNYIIKMYYFFSN